MKAEWTSQREEHVSAIPPNWLGSVIQGHGAQQRASENRSRETATEADVVRGHASERVSDAIDISDRDSEVYEDAEGQGGPAGHGQGRSDEEPAPAAEPPDADAEETPPKIDIQA